MSTSITLEEPTSSPAAANAPVTSPRKKKNRSSTTRKTFGDWMILLVAILIGLLIAVPFFLILINSFKSPADYNAAGPLTLPTDLYFDGMVNFWQR